MYIYGNYVCSVCLCILVCNCMHACYLLHDVYVLSEERTRWNRRVRRWGKIYYRRKGPGGTIRCEDGVKVNICDIRYMDVVVCDIRYTNVVVSNTRYMDVVVSDTRYIDVVVCDTRYMDVVVVYFIIHEHTVIFEYYCEWYVMSVYLVFHIYMRRIITNCKQI